MKLTWEPTGDEEQTDWYSKVTFETPQNDLSGEEMGMELRALMLALTYNPETVREVFGEDLAEEIENLNDRVLILTRRIEQLQDELAGRMPPLPDPEEASWTPIKKFRLSKSKAKRVATQRKKVKRGS